VRGYRFSKNCDPEREEVTDADPPLIEQDLEENHLSDEDADQVEKGGNPEEEK
jgi:hypothetical protein